jgi:hypothetical protein
MLAFIEILIAFGEQHYFGRDICVTIKRVSQHAPKGCLDVVTLAVHMWPVFFRTSCASCTGMCWTICHTAWILHHVTYVCCSLQERAEYIELSWTDIKAMAMQQSREVFAVGIQQPMLWWKVSLNSYGSYMQCHLLEQNRFHLNELQIRYPHTLYLSKTPAIVTEIEARNYFFLNSEIRFLRCVQDILWWWQ